jgi:hypothetical protein
MGLCIDESRDINLNALSKEFFREGIVVRRAGLSTAFVNCYDLPLSSAPVVFTFRVLPSADTTILL